MARPGRKRSAERIELERFACTFCGAPAGQSCSSASRPRRGVSLAHANRWRSLEAAQLQALRR